MLAVEVLHDQGRSFLVLPDHAGAGELVGVVEIQGYGLGRPSLALILAEDVFDILENQNIITASGFSHWADCEGDGDVDVFDILCQQNVISAP